MARRSGAGAAGIRTVNGDAGPDVVLDAADVGALPITGGTMQGDIDMGGFSVVNETLDQATTAISATTASMGLADVYLATSVLITITISSADIATAGRVFIFAGRNAAIAGGTPVTVDTEGAETIDGVASTQITADYGSITLRSTGAHLESVVS